MRIGRLGFVVMVAVGILAAPLAKFCPECAHLLAAITAAQLRFGSPQSYTPPHLAEISAR